MIILYKIFEDTQTQKFEIPEQIRKYYVIEGNMSNSKNWKSTKYFQPFTLYDQYKESALGIRYVLISLDSNHIIPINMNDEHQRGFDVLYNVFYDKYKVPREKYISVCTWGNHYIYEMENEKERQEQVLSIKKFLEYGGNPKLQLHCDGGKESGYKKYIMTAEQFVLTEGRYETYMKKLVGGKEISNVGKQFIEILEEFNKLWLKYVDIKTNVGRTQYVENEIDELIDRLQTFIFHYEYTYKLVESVLYPFFDKLSKVKNNTEGIGKIMLSHNGIKNNVHILLKDPKNQDCKDFFWNVKKAKEEFDRLSVM
jgi:hypothetical protein